MPVLGRALERGRQEELRQTASDLTAGAAREIVAQQMTPEDRGRLLDESVSKVAAEGTR